MKNWLIKLLGGYTEEDQRKALRFAIAEALRRDRIMKKFPDRFLSSTACAEHFTTPVTSPE